MESRKTRILFDATVLVDSLASERARTGIYFTAYNVFRKILARKDVEVVLFAKKPRRLRKYLRANFKGYDHIEIVDSFAGLKDIDALLSLRDPSNELAKEYLPHISCYAVVYDIMPILHPEWFNPAMTLGMWDMLDGIERGVNDHYFAISENTRNDMIRLGGIGDPERISVIPLAANEHFYPNGDARAFEAVRKKYNIPRDKKYILSLCAQESRKNLINAIKSFIEFIDKNHIDDLVYVLAGCMRKNFKGELRECFDNLGANAEKVINIGYVGDEDVSVLYSNAMWFIYTSHYEGFGLPLLEAMQCGCPVVAANNSSLPEVVGDAAIMVDSHDIGQHVEAYGGYYFNPELRQTNSRKGLERAKLFTWEKCVDTICEKIKRDVVKKLSHPMATVLIAANYRSREEDFAALQVRLESVRKQKYEKLEPLIVDCNADPGISERIRAYAAETGMRVKVVPGTDVYEACNVAAADTRGKYIAFLTAGMHYIDDRYVSICMEKNEEHEAELSYCDTLVSGGGAEAVWGGDISKILFGAHFSCASVFIGRSAFERMGGFPVRYGGASFYGLLLRLRQNKARAAYVRSIQVGMIEEGNSLEKSVEACAAACYDIFGRERGLSLSECHALYSGDWLRRYSGEEIVGLAGKIPLTNDVEMLWEKTVRSRTFYKMLNELRREETMKYRHFLFGIIPIPLTCTYRGDAVANVTTYHLFGRIPLGSLNRRSLSRTTFYLFNILPLFRVRNHCT